jgi:hypothetical protein
MGLEFSGILIEIIALWVLKACLANVFLALYLKAAFAIVRVAKAAAVCANNHAHDNHRNLPGGA